jgi:hypothetical protein
VNIPECLKAQQYSIRLPVTVKYTLTGHYEFTGVSRDMSASGKLRILEAIKKVWKSRVTTIFPKQGHYAHDPTILSSYPPADIKINRIGDLLACRRSVFVHA